MTQPKKAPRPKPDKGGCPLWMMTFGDAMSLLVTFFVMLIAFSSMEEDKLANVVGALQGALGATPMVIELAETTMAEQMMFSQPSAAEKQDLLNSIQGHSSEATYLSYEELSAIIPQLMEQLGKNEEQLKKEIINIQMLREGLSIILMTEPLFERGRGRMSREYTALWNGIAEVLSPWDNEFRITSVLHSEYPVHTASASTPWGLGILRSQQVAYRLQKAMDAPPTRFAIGAEVADHTARKEDGAPAEQMEIMISPANYLLDLGAEKNWSTEVWK